MRLLDQLITERAEITTTQEGVLTRAADETRDLGDGEEATLAALATRAVELDERITQLRSIADANAAAATVRADVTTRAADPTAPAATGAPAVVTREERTYEERGTHSFFSDLFHAQIMRDPVALDRITGHQREMITDGVISRDAGVAAAANLVVPQYLTELAAQYLRAGRPFADVCTSLSLPADGMSLNIHRTTTGVTAAIQASEHASVSETDFADTTLAVNIRTIAGQIDMSRQLVDRGSGIEQLVMQDLAGAYNETLDSQIINGAGTSGTHLGVLSTSGIGDRDITDSTPTPGEVWKQIILGLADVAADRKAPANVIVMHPRRWGSLYSGVDTTGRPLFGYNPQTARNPFGVGSAAEVTSPGEIGGVPVLLDANVPINLGAGTDEDRIIIARREDLLLWEDANAPMMVRFEEGQAAANNAASLSVKLVAYGYSGFAAGRYPQGVVVIQGDLLDTAGL
jgi:HK97 family phage major capsid protein